MQIEQLKEQAEGKWFGILKEFRIEVDETGNHTACPICGGKDRFRMEPDGTAYFCNQCDQKAGDTIQLIKKKTGFAYPEIIEKIAGMIGAIEPTKIFQPTKKDPSIYLKKLWKESEIAKPNDPVAKYLMARKMMIIPDDLRYCPECWNAELKKNIPAMLAIVRNRDGKPVSMHRTYLNGNSKADVEKPKMMLPGIEPLMGCAVRLFAVADGKLGVAEGIETAISCNLLVEIPVWAMLSTALMEGFVPPKEVRHVMVFADNDANYAGQKSAYALANKLYNKPYECNVEVFVPKKTGDFNDELIDLVG